NDLDMLDEIRTGALLARALHSAHMGLDAHHWLRFATLNGARALGLGDSIGSLTPGKWADVCCLGLARPHTQPVYDVAAQIVFAAVRRATRRQPGARRPSLATLVDAQRCACARTRRQYRLADAWQMGRCVLSRSRPSAYPACLRCGCADRVCSLTRSSHRCVG